MTLLWSDQKIARDGHAIECEFPRNVVTNIRWMVKFGLMAKITASCDFMALPPGVLPYGRLRRKSIGVTRKWPGSGCRSGWTLQAILWSLAIPFFRLSTPTTLSTPSSELLHYD